MRSRLPFFAALLALAACAQPDAPDSPSPSTADEVAAPSRDASTADASSAPAGPDADAADATTASARPPAADEDDAAPPMVEVNMVAAVSHATSDAETLTLRGGPSTRTESLGTFSDGFVLECQDRNRDDAWCRIRAEMRDGSEPVGWAKRRHLIYIGNLMVEENGVRVFGNADAWDIDGGGLSVNAVNARWDILADDGYANVRATPNGDVVRRLDNRTMTSVERCDDSAPGQRWCRISAPVDGWVHQSGFHRQLRTL